MSSYSTLHSGGQSGGQNTDVRQAALDALAHGLSTVPPLEDGTKAPDGRWKRYQRERATLDVVHVWYGTKGTPSRSGCGLVCGAVSGNLECLEFDAKGRLYERYRSAARAMGYGELIDRLDAGYLERSPSGGLHWLYRCAVISGNTKLAQYESEDLGPDGKPIVKPLIETRGEGGYIIVAPTNGRVHETGKPYVLLAGGFATIPTISPEERQALWDLARMFCELPESANEAKGPPLDPGPIRAGDLSPWDDFDSRASIGDILEPHGWKLVFTGSDGTEFWRRPGKDRSWSATFNHRGSGRFKCFTSSCPIPTEGTQSKFAVYAYLNHRGDFQEAARALRKAGYGSSARFATGKSAGGKADATKEKRMAEAGLPAIEVDTKQHRVLAETLAILPTDPGLYRQGDILVSIARHDEETARLHGGVELREAKGSVKTAPIGPASLSCRLTALADFFAWRKDKAGEDRSVAVNPPAWLPKAILEQGSFPGIRPLLGIIEAPFPRADGSLVTAPGYDRRTGYFYAPSVTIDPLPNRPTQRDAQEAADAIYQVVSQFPFADIKGDYAVWLAGLLSVIARPAIDGPVPGFAFIGNRAGVGKGRLIDVIGMIATGRKIPCSSYPESKEEAVKVRVAFALAGTPIIHLDNLEEGRLYGSGPLDSGLTSTEFQDRVLGMNKSPSLTLRAVWLLSGNKIAPGRDAYRRWLVCNLITEMESPEERTDLEHPDLLGYVGEHRSELVRSALIILAAHTAAGRPTGEWGPLGSFEAWDPIVRGAVWFATGSDCNATRKVAAKQSPERLNKIALLDAWSDLPGGTSNGTTVATALERAQEATQADLREVLLRFGRDGKLPTPTKLGSIIRTMASVPLEGKKFESAGQTGYGNALWKVSEST